MSDTDSALEKRIYDIIAVATESIDTVMIAVEDGVAYVEGAVPTEEERNKIINSTRQLEGLDRLITCLAVEHVLPRQSSRRPLPALDSTPVYMHYYSLS